VPVPGAIFLQTVDEVSNKAWVEIVSMPTQGAEKGVRAPQIPTFDAKLDQEIEVRNRF
jgi:hypothetical protein